MKLSTSSSGKKRSKSLQLSVCVALGIVSVEARAACYRDGKKKDQELRKAARPGSGSLWDSSGQRDFEGLMSHSASEALGADDQRVQRLLPLSDHHRRYCHV